MRRRHVDDRDAVAIRCRRPQRWDRRFAAAEAAGRVRDADYTTLSGMTVDPVYGPAAG